MEINAENPKLMINISNNYPTREEPWHFQILGSFITDEKKFLLPRHRCVWSAIKPEIYKTNYPKYTKPSSYSNKSTKDRLVNDRGSWPSLTLRYWIKLFAFLNSVNKMWMFCSTRNSDININYNTWQSNSSSDHHRCWLWCNSPQLLNISVLKFCRHKVYLPA